MFTAMFSPYLGVSSYTLPSFFTRDVENPPFVDHVPIENIGSPHLCYTVGIPGVLRFA